MAIENHIYQACVNFVAYMSSCTVCSESAGASLLAMTDFSCVSGKQGRCSSITREGATYGTASKADTLDTFYPHSNCKHLLHYSHAPSTSRMRLSVTCSLVLGRNRQTFKTHDHQGTRKQHSSIFESGLQTRLQVNKTRRRRCFLQRIPLGHPQLDDFLRLSHTSLLAILPHFLLQLQLLILHNLHYLPNHLPICLSKHNPLSSAMELTFCLE